jgi:hypothetical protein
MMDEVLNIEYKRNSLSRSDASEVHTTTYRHPVFKKSLFVFRGAENLYTGHNLDPDIFHDHNTFSYYVQEKVKSTVR